MYLEIAKSLGMEIYEHQMNIFDDMPQIQIFSEPSWNLSPQLMKLTEPIVIKERMLLKNELGLYINEIMSSYNIAHSELLCRDIEICTKKHHALIMNDMNLLMVSYEISNIIRLFIEEDQKT